jgi:two-component system, OmpR family, sensor kinase
VSIRTRLSAPWSLRRRLVVGILVLLTVMSAVIGTVSVLALHQNLMSRLDSQVTGSARFATCDTTGGPGNAGPGRRVGNVVYIQSSAGDLICATYTKASGQTVSLTQAQRTTLAAVAAGVSTDDPGAPPRPVSVDLGSLGAFRVVGAAVTNQSTGAAAVLVTGQSLGEVSATTTTLILIFVLVTLVALIAAGFATALIVRAALRPLGRVAATATRVAELPLDKGEVALEDRVPDPDTDPRTEVGQVGAAFNRMLGHVEDALRSREASESKVRQFVADASHELRTPLASIRGYSELTRRGGHELPDDVVRALGRIESESVRMTSLVEDLLLLARLDAGRELVLGDVDLVSLAIDTVSDAHAAGPEHEWALDAPETPIIVAGDHGRLHQVIANLLTNARVHTPEGTHVTVTLTTEGREAVLTVADDGPGIPEDLQPVLFERFARGDGSRSRATGSTGLGLAIVAAVVDGHHGSVQAESRPGDTRFTVRLPLRAG